MGDDGEIKFTTEVRVGNKRYVPYIPLDENDPISTGAVKLPTDCIDYGSERELIREIQEHIHKYVDVSPRFERFSAWYVLLTWLYDRMSAIPYLRALGDTGTGKSRFLDVVGGLCYKPCMVSGAITPAPIYRMIRQWKGTIILDEADFRDSNEKNEVIKILNCGFEQRRPVIRCKQNDVDTLQYLPTYCPKIIATRRTFSDKALESRCLTEKMVETDRKDIPDVLPPEFYEEQERLRNKLLMFRLRNYKTFDTTKIYQIDLGDVEPRLRQATRSFAALFSAIPSMMDEFKKFLREYNRELVEERSETLEGMIVATIFSLKKDGGNEKISSSDIVAKLQTDYGIKDITPQSVGKRLKSLGIERKKEGDKRCIIWDDKLMNKLAKRYIPGFGTDEEDEKKEPKVPDQQEEGTSGTSETSNMGEPVALVQQKKLDEISDDDLKTITLSIIPKEPRSITIEEISQRLKEKGLEVDTDKLRNFLIDLCQQKVIRSIDTEFSSFTKPEEKDQKNGEKNQEKEEKKKERPENDDTNGFLTPEELDLVRKAERIIADGHLPLIPLGKALGKPSYREMEELSAILNKAMSKPRITLLRRDPSGRFYLDFNDKRFTLLALSDFLAYDEDSQKPVKASKGDVFSAGSKLTRYLFGRGLVEIVSWKENKSGG